MGVQFTVNKFSTFTMVYMEGWKEYFTALQAVLHKPYISGFTEGTFGPDKHVTRSQMAAMLSHNLDMEYGASVTNSFKDVMATHWAFEHISVVNQAGLMIGYTDGRFGLEDGITRAEMAMIAYKWLEKHGNVSMEPLEGSVFTDLSIEYWAYEAIMNIEAAGIMSGYTNNTFRPDYQLTRAEAVTVINRLLNRGPLYRVEKSSFSDVGPLHWAFYDIEEAAIEHKQEQEQQGD